MIGGLRADRAVPSSDRPQVDHPPAESRVFPGLAPVPAYPERPGSLRSGEEPAAYPSGLARAADSRGVRADPVDHPVPSALRRSTPVGGAKDTNSTGHPSAFPVIRRYFEQWPAAGQEEQDRKARFVGFVQNAKTAGIDSYLAETAGLSALKTFEGWTNARLPDFDYAWINGTKGFRTLLTEHLEEAGIEVKSLGALLDEVFKANADPGLLEGLGRAAGFKPGAQEQAQQFDIDPDQEKLILDTFAKRFDSRGSWDGQGDVFRSIWLHASAAEKERIMVVLVGPDWKTATDFLLPMSDLSYLVEGVTGKTPKEPEKAIKLWAQSPPTRSLFEFMRHIPSYDTKYMTAEEREEYRLILENGQVTRATDHQPLVGDSIFVLGGDDKLYGGVKQPGRQAGQPEEGEKKQALHHSSFMAGEPVNCAGHFITNGSGKLIALNNQSGHYTPNEFEFGVFLYGLEESGRADLREVMFENRTAAEFLQQWKDTYLPKGESEEDTEEEDTEEEDSEEEDSEEEDTEEEDTEQEEPNNAEGQVDYAAGFDENNLLNNPFDERVNSPGW